MFSFSPVGASVSAGRSAVGSDRSVRQGSVVVRAKWPGRRKRRDYGVTAEEITRRGSADFGPSLAALKDAIGRACRPDGEWEARIVAGIVAIVEFAQEDPAAARALTVCAGAQASDGTDLEGEMLAYFAGLLEDVAPDEMLFPISSAEGIVETTAVLIRGYLLAGRSERIVELGPELVYLTLMPYVGLESAKRWASTVSPGQPKSTLTY
jgi:hypothetical protein